MTRDDRITLRLASLADLETLRHWDTQPHVIAATGADLPFDWPAELAWQPDWRELLMAEVGSRPIGMLQIIDPAREETHYWGAVADDHCAIDIWIGEAADLGRGYGTAMMRLALARCFADARVNAVLVDPLVANVRAHRFYERIGFCRIGPRRFGADDCVVYRIDRAAAGASGISA